MTDPEEASEDLRRTSRSGGEPDQQHHDNQRPGTDVGGPATALQPGVENSLTEPSSPGDDADPDSQSRNPL